MRKSKIDIKTFNKLFYQDRLPTKEIAKHFNLAPSSIDTFRQRNHLPPRGVSTPYWKGKHRSQETVNKISNKLKGHIALNKIYPDFWICKQCNKSFPNLTGHKRTFCSKICYDIWKIGKNTGGTFQPKDKHWNYNPNRGEVIDRKKDGTVFSYKEKVQLLKIFNFRCNMCKHEFPHELLYKLKNHNLVFDHIIPIKLGGEHSINNGQILCKSCNKIKTHNDILAILKIRSNSERHGYSKFG